MCEAFVCPAWMVKCGPVLCRVGGLCDGITDCDDGSDEEASACLAYDCPLWTVKCNGTLCFSSGLCDGVVDCREGTDEGTETCSAASCPAGSVQCNGTLCISSKLCDGVVDCEEGSDENVDMCRDYECPRGLVKCSDSTCRPRGSCNRTNSCHDGAVLSSNIDGNVRNSSGINGLGAGCVPEKACNSSTCSDNGSFPQSLSSPGTSEGLVSSKSGARQSFPSWWWAILSVLVLCGALLVGFIYFIHTTYSEPIEVSVKG